MLVSLGGGWGGNKKAIVLQTWDYFACEIEISVIVQYHGHLKQERIVYSTEIGLSFQKR